MTDQDRALQWLETQSGNAVILNFIIGDGLTPNKAREEIQSGTKMGKTLVKAICLTLDQEAQTREKTDGQ